MNLSEMDMGSPEGPHQFLGTIFLAIGLLSAFILAEPVCAETLADYATVKTARCFSGCTRNAQYAPSPARGVTIDFGNGVLSSTFSTKIVDFEKRTAALVITTIEHDGSGKPDVTSTDQKETTLSEEELSYAISLANRIWGRPLPPPRQPGSPPPPPPSFGCFDSFYTFTLLDEGAVLPILDPCAFRNDKDRVNERSFAIWLDSVLARAQPVVSTRPLPGTVIASFPVPPAGWGDFNLFVDILGVVERADDNTITVKTDRGAMQTLKIAPYTLYLENKPATFSDIKEGDSVASPAIRKGDGKLHSIELSILRDVMHGTGGEQYSLPRAPNQIITRSAVTGTATVNGNNIIKLPAGFPDAELIVDPCVPVTALVPADKGLVKAGTKVSVQGEKTSEGLVAGRITLQ